MKVKYCGPAKDYSGYGEANRHDIAALLQARVQVTGQFPSYVHELSDYGELGQRVLEVEAKDQAYPIKIIHTTPDQFGYYREDGVYNIGRLFWETDKLPEVFAENANLMDEIWTGSAYNKKAIVDSGVTVPVYIIPEAIDTKPGTFTKFDTAAEGYTFYSIFEWTQRKNPFALLVAYWQEFTEKDDVSLVLKTYVDNFMQHNKDIVRNQIFQIKEHLGQDYYAPLLLYKDLMDRKQIYRFHKSFDCFVSAHRGEGWGIPQMEAMLMSKPIISTNCGGIHDYLTDKKDALLLPYKLTRVDEKHRKWYTSDQNWAEVDIVALRKCLRWAYEHPKEAKLIGKAGRVTVGKKFSLQAVGDMMRARLEQIEPTLWENTEE